MFQEVTNYLQKPPHITNMSTSGGGGASNGTTPAETSGGAASANGGGGDLAVSSITSAISLMSGEERLKELESLFCGGPEGAHEAKSFSIETLLDILLILFNECCNSSLRKEKTVTDFIELGKTF